VIAGRDDDDASRVAMTGRDRAAVVLLVWAVGVFGLISAVHSVHHVLDGDADARHCPVAFAAQHVDGNSAEPPSAEVPILISERAEPTAVCTPHPTPMFRPDEGRAPPPALSAA
jgi:hypothetical protein